MSRSDRPPADQPFLGYQLIDKLDDGGYGQVYRALHIDSGTLRALKLLHPDLARDESCRRRLQHEGAVLRKTQHPHLVRVIDYGLEPWPFLAMEFLVGETLQRRLQQRGALSRELMLKVGYAVVEA